VASSRGDRLGEVAACAAALLAMSIVKTMLAAKEVLLNNLATLCIRQDILVTPQALFGIFDGQFSQEH
jgi:hypothetical protein